MEGYTDFFGDFLPEARAYSELLTLTIVESVHYSTILPCTSGARILLAATEVLNLAVHRAEIARSCQQVSLFADDHIFNSR